ncbi:hypothetical protein ACVI1N_004476 [Sinorhizobium medicae]
MKLKVKERRPVFQAKLSKAKGRQEKQRSWH